jgi:RNA polymerase sigma factor (sigma-70 family)
MSAPVASSPSPAAALLSMADPGESWRLFLADHIDTIDRAAQGCCADEQEGAAVAADVLERLARDWPEILRRYEERTSGAAFRTWLAVVARRAAIDVLRSIHGRWEPPRPLRRLPRWQRRLHRLLHRDGHDLHGAGEQLRAEGLFDGDYATLAAAAARIEALIPAGSRTPRAREVPLPTRSDDGQPLVEVEAGEDADPALRGARGDARARFSELLDSVPEEDRVLLRLYFLEGFTASDLQAVTGGRTKSQVYNRIHAVTQKLRTLAEQRGLSAGDLPVAEHLDWEALLASRMDDVGRDEGP